MKHEKWLSQAAQDLKAAELLRASGHHEWACFLALQAAEKAEKAYFYALDMEPPFRQGRDGHDLVKLSNAWPTSVRAAMPKLADVQTDLNNYAENTRYPHRAVARGGVYLAPHEDYGDTDSEQAIQDARDIVAVCEKLAREGKKFADSLGGVLAQSTSPSRSQ